MLLNSARFLSHEGLSNSGPIGYLFALIIGANVMSSHQPASVPFMCAPDAGTLPRVSRFSNAAGLRLVHSAAVSRLTAALFPCRRLKAGRGSVRVLPSAAQAAMENEMSHRRHRPPILCATHPPKEQRL